MFVLLSFESQTNFEINKIVFSNLYVEKLKPQELKIIAHHSKLSKSRERNETIS